MTAASLGERTWIDRLRFFNKRVTNRITMTFAGKRVYAIVYHVGRRSGKTYTTPVVAMPGSGGYYIPLPYGENTDWCRNIFATGGCRLVIKRRSYAVDRPRLAEPYEALPSFPRWMYRLLRRTEIYLHVSLAEV
jgi:deazaflavin-dependent oxidoreductase (nitroreductase family)